MTLSELRSYIRLLIVEVQDNARVPDQLRPRKGKKNPDEKPAHTSADYDPRKSKSKEDKDEVDEMSVVGNIVGMSLPLGMSPGEPSITGSPRKKRKIKHDWK